MIVLDASVVLEIVAGTRLGVAIGRRVLAPEQSLHVPHLVDVEVTQVLRKCVRLGTIEEPRARAALDLLAALGLARHPHLPLARRVWALRDNLTAYDAVYVALAEVLDATLLTRDRRLAGSSGVHRARVEVVD